jgi:voltage-gated potassium channel
MPDVRPWNARRRRLALQAVALVAFYYLVPVSSGLPAAQLWARGIGAALLLGAAVWFVIRTVAHEARATDAEVDLERLGLAALTGIIVFALADLVIARVAPHQFTGLATKTDALYFTLTTLTTVGYGDVHADGQLARQVVTLQLVFNVVVLAGAARTLTRGVAGRSRAGRGGERPAE